MKTKHTPGPWQHTDSKIISLSSWFVPPDESIDDPGIRTTVVELRGAMGGDDINADAKLIAAAPELLEALKECEEIIWAYKGLILSQHHHNIEDIHNKTKLAIHKATGI